MGRRILVCLAACALTGITPPVWAQSMSSFGVVQVQRGRAADPLRRPGGYQEPAYARGFADGLRQGADDRRDRGRYDPVGHRDYRDGDQGYDRSYGSRDAYRNNYRAGYRLGYEEGFRGRRVSRWR